MTSHSRRRVVALTTTAVLAIGLLGAAPANGGPGTTASAPTTVAMTRIVVTMARCEGCTVRAARFYSRNGRTVSARYLTAARVRNGVAVLRVPRAATTGMAFEVVTPDHAGTGNAVPVVTLRFARTVVGSTVTARSAMRSRSGSWCWAGTRAATISLPLAVVRWTQTAPGPDQGPQIAVWSKTMRPVLAGTFGPTYKGGMGHQDAPYCTVS